MCSEHSCEDLQLQPDRKPALPRSDEEKQRMINRLKRIEGQVRGLQKMVEDDRYCVDILIQLSAVQAALKKVGFSVMERHTKTCVAGAIREGNGEHHIDELLKVMQQFSK
ncbi:transcriptional regulator [Pullulanibacillus camelliae]|uniref:Transcriptional regulator n=1 Tax=Pullulanibacillus camelliae TaxID=1707096 RepID=A0A8J2VMW0_9BACL|nr:metal-sensing transcriptional repressor [Pullulanibacillus camelliae]GGE34041.1 transcriptional regulator [Pullulanibacillus camelliae]